MGVAALGCGVAGCGSRGSDLALSDANNYHYAGELVLDRVQVAPQQDATLDWSALTVDLRGRAVEPGEIDQLSFVRFVAEPDEVESLLAANELGQDDAGTEIYTYSNDGRTSCALTELGRGADPYDPGASLLVEDGAVWIATAMNLPDGRQDILASVMVLPATGAGDAVPLTSASTSMTTEVDLHSGEVVKAKADRGSETTVTWTDVGADVFGHPLDPLVADQLWIARFDQDVAELESRFLELDALATVIHRFDVYGVTAIDLAVTPDLEGASFGGFTRDGTWLVGLVCTRCANPVPLVLAVVDAS